MITPPPVPSPRQTLTYIHELLRSRGLIPKHKLGQNFLIDLNLVDRIVETAEIDRSDCVLEVGTGTGSLTARISDHAGAVVSVELDPDFHKLAGDLLASRGNVWLLHEDILLRKNANNPRVLDELKIRAKNAGCTRFKLVANLPYVVATPVICNLLLAEIPIERMVVMVQWELAERMMSSPRSKEYGSLAVLVQSLADVKMIRRLSPGNFWPMPKVDSAILLIKPDPAKRAELGDPVPYRAFLRDLYTQRRKNVRSALAGWPSGRREKKDVDAKLVEIGIDGSVRAETLDLAQHRRLFEAFRDFFPSA
ncbi:MAG: 16S rRNA (adenine(1518)-N(6)/adenine(1519)-N(6))-dimethyltransferase RsmA [Planctomycetes bacterium]|nr:16S rRNA (adenine(1518)-N(6)/adenine(1519)-N(6))-dimethyltransferase RsmA [Planctomycetota bacterium]